MSQSWTGILPSLATPFTSDDELDVDATAGDRAVRDRPRFTRLDASALPAKPFV